jgi:peptidyl-prolyl cis-trans isomerase B (cyclophilin B)
VREFVPHALRMTLVVCLLQCACAKATPAVPAAEDVALDAVLDGEFDGALDAALDATAVDSAADVTAAVVTNDPAIAAIQAQVDAAAVDKTVKNWRTKLPKPTPVQFTPGRKYFWLLTTDKGPMKLQLRPDAAPMHVTSTIYLTLFGFYDTLKFHRIILGFMAQGGDPLGTGGGGPGYVYGLEASAAAKHDARGVLSMANAGTATDTEGSQFFITFTPQPKLDGGYSVFGKLVAGDDTLTAIEAGGTKDEGVPVKVKILAATVTVE